MTVSNKNTKATQQAIKVHVKPALAEIGEAFARKAQSLDSALSSYPASEPIAIDVYTTASGGQPRVSPAFPGLSLFNDSSCSAYSAAFHRLEKQGLISCAWSEPVSGVSLPRRAAMAAGDYVKLRATCGSRKIARKHMVRAVSSTAAKAEPLSKEAALVHGGNIQPAYRNDKEALELVRKVEILEILEQSCDNESISRWASTQARRIRSGVDSLDKAVMAPSIDALEKAAILLVHYPQPASPSISRRIASAREFDDSKALEGAVGKALAGIIDAAAAIPSEQPRAFLETLEAWGFVDNHPLVRLAGDFCIEGPFGRIDFGEIDEGLAVEPRTLEQATRAHARGCRAVIIVENLVAWKAAAEEVGDLAVFAYCDGSWGAAARRGVEALRRLLAGGEGTAPVYLWFDIDPGGLSRESKLAMTMHGAVSILMDVQVYATASRFWGYSLTDGAKDVLSTWGSKTERDAWLDDTAELMAARGLGVEQEVLLAHGLAQNLLRAKLEDLPRLNKVAAGARQVKGTLVKSTMPLAGAGIAAVAAGALAAAAQRKG